MDRSGGPHSNFGTHLLRAADFDLGVGAPRPQTPYHLLPFLGKAHVAYLPNGKIVGLSKLARVVEVLARRPQVQERMVEELADLFMEELRPRGVAVILEASHSCMTCRGVRKSASIAVTSAMRGSFRDNQSRRAELMALLFGSR